eukprot:997320-Rhodomonas_salina.1
MFVVVAPGQLHIDNAFSQADQVRAGSHNHIFRITTDSTGVCTGRKARNQPFCCVPHRACGGTRPCSTQDVSGP